MSEPPPGPRPARGPAAVALIALILAGLGIVLLAGAGHGLGRRHVVVAGVPVDEVHPAGRAPGQRRPGVVVAHGFAGSAELMAPFGDSLAARGYVVVLLDFAGHGANVRPLPDDAASTAASTAELQHDLDVAVTHLRSLPDVDPAAIALVGHSMGATEVTRYAAAHPAITTTVALSLPGASVARSNAPERLLLLYGAAEFPGFRAAATEAAAHGGAGRRASAVPGVEHISILYAPRAHEETVAWLDRSFGGPPDSRPLPSPLRRIGGAALLTLAFLVGLHPLARLLLPGGGRWPRLDPRLLGRALVVALAAGIPAALLARFLPTARLPIAVGGYLAGYAAVLGVLLTAYGIRRPAGAPRRGGWRGLPLVGYAALAIALPLHLGLTHAVPAGPRWWLLPVLWAGFALAAYGAERATGGDSLGVLLISAVVVAGLIGAAVTGLTHGFVLLAVPPLVLLFGWQAWWSAVLNRFAAPPALIALTGSLVVAWPLAIALPLIA